MSTLMNLRALLSFYLDSLNLMAVSEMFSIRASAELLTHLTHLILIL